MKRQILPIAALVSFYAFLASCDSRQAQVSVASEPTVTLAPRISMSNGDSVLQTDSVRIVVSLDGNRFLDTVVDFRRHSLAIPGVPVGSNYRIDVSGFYVAADGRHFPVLWQGSQTGTVKPALGPVLWDKVIVNEKDTTSPTLEASGLPASGDITLAFGSTSVSKTFLVSPTDTVYVGTSKLTPDNVASGFATYTILLKKDSTVQVVVVSTKNTVSVRTYRVAVSVDATS
ncbi:MAG: hypothetical protein AAB214_04185, partial [Fibrobacterota bacterium]